MSFDNARHLYATTEVNDIRSALEAIAPDLDYENWYQVGMALKAELGEAGYYIFDEWSQGSDQYKTSEIRQKWRSFKRNGITIKSVFKLAIENGWRPDKDLSYTPKPVDKDLLARERKEKRKSEHKAAETALGMWDAAVPAQNHSYLQRKCIRAYRTRVLGDALLIPMSVGTRLWSIQRIYPNGGKYFLADGKVNGCYYSFGRLDACLWICEGFADGASIFESTGDAVAVAFSGGNMARVATYFRKQHPGIELLIASDSDQAGRVYAVAAMKAGTASKIVFPDFKHGDSGKDWNDYYRHYGAQKTLEALT